MRSEVLIGQYLDIRGGATRAGLAECHTILRYKSARYTVERPLQIGAVLAGAGPAEAANRKGICRFGKASAAAKTVVGGEPGPILAAVRLD